MAASKKKSHTPATDADDLITQSEAAEILGKSLAAVNDLVRRGRLQSEEKFGRRLVYRSEVENFQRDPRGRKS